MLEYPSIEVVPSQLRALTPTQLAQTSRERRTRSLARVAVLTWLSFMGAVIAGTTARHIQAASRTANGSDRITTAAIGATKSSSAPAPLNTLIFVR